MGRQENHEPTLHRDGMAVGNALHFNHDPCMASDGVDREHSLWPVPLL